MLKSGLTYEDVASAAAVLSELGQDVSVNTVHRHLGAGSRFIIGRHLARWRSEQGVRPLDGVQCEDVSDPDSITDGSLARALESLGHALHVSAETQMQPLHERTQLLAGELASIREQLAAAEAASAGRVEEISSSVRSRDRSLVAKIEQIARRLDVAEQTMTSLQAALKEADKKWKQDWAGMAERLERTSREQGAAIKDLGNQVSSLVDAQSAGAKLLRKQELAVQAQIATLEERLGSHEAAVASLAVKSETRKSKKTKD